MTTEKGCVVSGADGQFAYEAAAGTVAVILTVRNNNKDFEILIKMRPYDAKRVLAMRQEQQVYLKPAKDEYGATDIERSSVDADARFFDEHFISAEVRGRVLSQEEFERLDARYALKVNAVNVGLNGIKTEISDDTEGSIDDLLADTSVKQHAFFADDSGKERKIDFAHRFRTPTAADSLAYGKTSKVRTLEGNIQRVAINHETRVKLYDQMIQSIDGIVFNGASCSESNKAEWVKEIPLLFKLAAIEQVFRGSFRKNV